ncbi:MAG TPA: RebB family R body protein [Blastocatellia bacterium]|nr:RebB family R body protein [Blastocatellia bacterium]
MATDHPGKNNPSTGAVNSQITDAVTQANIKVLGEAPTIAMGNLYQATAQALANAAHNAVSAQQQASILNQAAADAGITLLYPFATGGQEIAETDIEAYLEGILEAHRKSKNK